MKTPQANAVQNGNQKKSKANSGKGKPDVSQGLRDLFVDELKDIYWAERALVKAIPKMISNASSTELVDALTGHLEVTKQQVSRLEEVFASINVVAVAKKCEAMSGLIMEAGELVEEIEKGVVRDAGIIAATQKIEHYEIATYGTLAAFARTLGEEEAVALLEDTLSEEKEADEKLTGIAESSINLEAAEGDTISGEDEVDEEVEENSETFVSTKSKGK